MTGPLDLEARLREIGRGRAAHRRDALDALLADAGERAASRAAPPRLGAAAALGLGAAAVAVTVALPSPADEALDDPLRAALRGAFEPLRIPPPIEGDDDR